MSERVQQKQMKGAESWRQVGVHQEFHVSTRCWLFNWRMKSENSVSSVRSCSSSGLTKFEYLGVSRNHDSALADFERHDAVVAGARRNDVVSSGIIRYLAGRMPYPAVRSLVLSRNPGVLVTLAADAMRRLWRSLRS